MEIYSLKIKRWQAGTEFPFDRVYLVNYEDRARIEELFRHALVLPVEGELKNLLRAQVPDEVIDHAAQRDDVARAPAVYTGGATEWETFLEKNWILVVPILTKWINQAMPKYLTNLRWYESKRARKRAVDGWDRSPFPNMTYLQTPERKIRPVCVVCPRFIEHQNGDCHLGQRVCYEALPLGLQNYFDSGLKSPPPTENEKELQVHDVDVQKEHA